MALVDRAVVEGAGLGPDPEEQREYRLYAVGEGLRCLLEEWAENAAHLPVRVPLTDQRDLQEACLGLLVEVGELTNSLQWKSWRKYGPMTPAERAEMLKEFGDVLVFLARLTANMGAMHGITAEELAEGWRRVSDLNGARFRGEVPGREPPVSPEGAQP